MDENRYREAERALWESVSAHPTEQQVQLRRTGTIVRIQEVGEGPAVLFVHGASNAGTSWAHLAARLGGFRCILLDRPGCGLSPRLETRLADVKRLGAFADALVVDVLDALSVPASHLIGTSFGGYIVLRSAAAHPDRVSRLVEFGWMVGAPIESTPLAMRLATLPFVGRLLTRIPPNERMVRSLLRQIGLRQALESGRFGEVEIAWFLSLLRDTDTMRNEIDTLPRLVTMRGVNDEIVLPASLPAAVILPALFLWGEHDPMGGEAIARRFVSRLPDAELEMLPGAGHAPWLDDPDGVADRVGRFLQA